MDLYNSLQLREIFHIEFLRWLARKVKPDNYVLKGGVNLRFFFKSFRYSEDMDIDVFRIRVDTLKDIVLKILSAPSFNDSLRTFGCERIIPPDIAKAKQTETTQRFKVHLINSEGIDLFTKIEFSRRGFKGEIVSEPVSDIVLREYKIPPLMVSHYDISSTILQKVEVLALRSVIQARDIFDLYILSPQHNKNIDISKNLKQFNISLFKKARENIFAIDFSQFRDTVISYLSPNDQAVYNKTTSWDEIRLNVENFIEELEKKCQFLQPSNN
ncbi:MAG: nucleotidyl transferase AbiEii/AbiGii toxin family protein [bacterium]